MSKMSDAEESLSSGVCRFSLVLSYFNPSPRTVDQINSRDGTTEVYFQSWTFAISATVGASLTKSVDLNDG